MRKKYEGVTLSLLSFAGQTYQPALRLFASEFEAKTGAVVRIVAFPSPLGWWYMEPVAQADAVSEDPQFDIFCDDREWQYYLLPHVLSLTEMIERFNYDMDGFFQPIYDYDEGVAGEAGARYGLPLRMRAPFIFYRTDLIEKFPTTWDEYDTMLATHNRGERHGLAVEGAVYPHHPFGFSHDLTKLFLARYWSLGDPLLTPEWQPLINSEKGVEALHMLRRQVSHFAAPDGLTWDVARAARAFLNGEVAVIETTGVALLPYLQDPNRSQIVKRWSVGRYPGRGAAPCTIHNLSIFRHCKNPEVAFEFVAYCTGIESAKRLHLDYGEHSARKTALISPQALTKDPTLGKRAEVLNRSIPTIPGIPRCYEMLFALWEAVQLCLHGYLSEKPALDRAAEKWIELVEATTPDWEYREADNYPEKVNER